MTGDGCISRETFPNIQDSAALQLIFMSTLHFFMHDFYFSFSSSSSSLVSFPCILRTLWSWVPVEQKHSLSLHAVFRFHFFFFLLIFFIIMIFFGICSDLTKC